MSLGRARSSRHHIPIREYPDYPHNSTESLDPLNSSDEEPTGEDQDEDRSSILSEATFPPHYVGLPSRPDQSIPLYRIPRSRTRGYKIKVSLRCLRMPGLILLSIVAIVSFVFVPWHQSRAGLVDLNRLRNPEKDLDAFSIHNISAPDGSIYGSFVGIGASVQSLFVKDRHGSFRDIVLGFDNTSEYLHNSAHPRFGSIVGRYANRIKNSSFVLPGHPDRPFRITPNEHNGLNTLHGGTPGWDRRNFKVEAKNLSYISFSLIDPDGEQGFPSQVVSKIEYELLSGGKWKIKMHAKAAGETPLMLSSHVYWNLDGYSSNEAASSHILHLKAPHYIPIDPILIPTGKIASVSNTPLDFTKPMQIGSRFNQTVGLCGQGCTGYDNALIYDIKRPKNEPAMQMWSDHSGIKMSVITDQAGIQIYSCNGILSHVKGNKPIPRKRSQGGPHAIYENFSCLVIEQQGLVDAINNPQWNFNSFYGPDRPYEWNAVYEFTTI